MINPGAKLNKKLLKTDIEQVPTRDGFGVIGIIVIVAVVLALIGSYAARRQKIGIENRPGIFCGGISGIICPKGYFCELENNYPDALGQCINNKGELFVKVSIGPNCPVEQVNEPPCPAPPEAYASREFLILSSDQKTIIATFHANRSGDYGTYEVLLPPGTYTINSAKTGIGYMSKDLPATITIKAGEATSLDVNVDTGIRSSLSIPTGTVDTSKWKTYRSEEYGFEFKYPANFIPKRLTRGVILESTFGEIEVYVADDLKEYPSCYFTEEQKLKKQVGNYQWISCSWGWAMHLNNNRLYTVQLMNGVQSQNLEKGLEFVEKITESFKLL